MSALSSSNTLSDSDILSHTMMPFEEGREEPDARLETHDEMKREPGETEGIQMEARQQSPVTVGKPKKYSHNFWDPEIKHLRHVVFKILGTATLITIAVTWACVPVFWGSVWKTESYTNRLKIFVIDYDTPTSPLTPSLGSFIVNATLANFHSGIVDGVGQPDHTTPKGTLGFTQISTIDYPTTQSVITAVLNERAWGAVIINPHASAEIQSSRQNGNDSYIPTSAVTFIYAQARSEQATGSYILPILHSVLGKALPQWNAQSLVTYLGEIGSNTTALTALTRAPTTVNPGAYYGLANLRPYSATVTSAVTFLGFIYLIIFSFILTMNGNAARDIIAPFLTTKSLLVSRLVIPLVLYFWITLTFAMIDLPFHVPFGAKYRYGQGFVLWWMYLWAGMSAVGLATEFFVTLLTPKFVAFCIFPFIIFNVSVVGLPAELQPWFYRYQPASPFFQLNRAVRVIIFDTKNVLGESIGVLLAWIVCSMCTITLITLLYRRRDLKAFEKAHAEETEKQV